LLGLAVVEDVVVSAATERIGFAAAPFESVFPVGVALDLLNVAYLTAGREPADGVPAGGDQCTDDQAQRLHDGRPSEEVRQQCPVPGTASIVTHMETFGHQGSVPDVVGAGRRRSEKN